MDTIHLLDKKVTLYQPDKGFRTSQDAVLLAAACPAKDNETVLDMGCGVGGATFCLSWREPSLKITGIEIEQTYLDLAQRNAQDQDQDIEFIHDDLQTFSKTSKRLFHHVICNPPYFDSGKHINSPDSVKATARGYLNESDGLEAWIKSSLRLLKSRGSLTIIHMAEKLDDIIRLMGAKFGATEIIPIYSKVSEPAKRIIIRSYKDRKSPLKLYAPLLMHELDGKPSAVSDLLLRDGLSFDKVFEELRRHSK